MKKAIGIVGIAISIALAKVYIWDSMWLFGFAGAMIALWERWTRKNSE